MKLLDRVLHALGSPIIDAATKAPQSVSSYGRGPYARVRVQMALQGFDPRNAGAQMLRNFSRKNEWVRLAINHRKRKISPAKWKLVRLDNPKLPPDPRVVKVVGDLLRSVNPKRESFRSLLDQVIEDRLVVDAGCIEKERTLGGGIAALWAVDGATIVPDPTWDGSDPEAPRYYQFIDGRPAMREDPPGSGNWVQVTLRNQDLIYIMGTPTTYSPIGWSVVETLVRAIEADLYGEQYDFNMLQQAAPAGLLDLGRGIPRQQLEEARDYYQSEIAGSQDMMIVGIEPNPGDPNSNTGPSATFVPFGRSNKDQQRDFYKTWLVKKIACVFEMDPTVFGITGDVNRATSKTMSARTDEGHVAEAKLISEFITREYVWEIDENHGFEFDEITDRDEKQQADIDKQYSGAGIWTINEIRARQGLDPVEWGDAPFSSTAGPLPTEAPDPNEDPNGDGSTAHADGTPNASQDDDDEDETGSGKTARPFVAARRQTQRPKTHYLNDFAR